MDKVAKHKLICEQLNDIYARKNADYGDSFGKSFKDYGLTMACIRLDDKLNRLKALRTADAHVKDESIEDTLLDLANYAIMTVIELRGEDMVVPTKDPCEELIAKMRNAHHDLPRVGSHYDICAGVCPCNTCRRDNTETEGVASCCDTHRRNCSDSTPCPDYVPDCEEVNNEI